MEISLIILKLANQAEAIHALTEEVSPEQARWKPNPESWSMLEVIHHLADEELEDFRGHLVELLENPARPWRKIAPQRWVTERQYNQQDFQAIRKQFFQARAESLAWLKELPGIDPQAAYHLEWGDLSAGDLLASWAAHDLLSIRHLTELNYQYLKQMALPDDTRYAGDW